MDPNLSKIFDERRHYEIGFLLGGLLYIPLGWFYADYSFQFQYDGWVERLPVGLTCFVCYCLSKKNYVSISGVRILTLIVGLWLTQDFIGRASKHYFHIVYLTGSIQIPLIVSLVFYHKLDSLIYFAASLILGVYSFQDHYFFSKFYVPLVGTFYITYFFFLSNRKSVVELLKISNENLVRRSRDLERLNSLAVQVAHDIRAPVTALDFVSKTLEVSDPKKQQIIKEASNRINDIADQLLREFKANPSLPSDLLSNVEPALNHNSNGIPVKQYNIGKAISSVVAEKKTIVRNDIEIITSLAQVHYDIRTSLDPVEFKRILSNILNNSIEAFDDGQGKISITATDSPRFVNINIQDNGKGVPSQLLHKLMERGFSFGKERGTGVGLSHAKEALESVGGTLEVLSKQGKGTLVILSMPKI